VLNVLPNANQPPKAYIDVITPTEATAGQTVRFVGHGTDVDVRWWAITGAQAGRRARRDRRVETSALSVGSHTIYFSVQDNNGLWSEEVSSSIAVAAAPAPPIIDSFDASLLTIHAGDSVTLAWKVSNAGTVTIDQVSALSR
jgi:plastocyanin